MDWLSKSIIFLWDGALGYWADHLEIIEGILTLSPTEFGGGNVWNTVDSIYNAIQGTGYALLVLFFYVGVFKTTSTFVEFKRPEVVFRTFLRLVLVKGLLDSGKDILLAIVQVGQEVISSVFSSSLFTEEAMTLPDELRLAVQDAGFLEKLLLLLVSIIAVLVIVVVVYTILLTVYGRFLKIYAIASFAPIPLSTFGAESTQSTGIGYLRGFCSVCLEGAVIAICCVIYSAIATSIPTAGIVGGEDVVLVKLINYAVTVIFNTLLLSTTIKGADWLLHKMGF